MTEDSAWTWITEATLPSERGAGHQVLSALIRRIEQSGWDKQEIFGIHLAVEEALVNAIRHGNRSDQSKQVQVSCKVAPHHLIVEITDEGHGFNPDRVPDCTTEENLHRPGGRGIMLMRNYMSRVEYLNGGQRVVMEKRRA